MKINTKGSLGIFLFESSEGLTKEIEGTYTHIAYPKTKITVTSNKPSHEAVKYFVDSFHQLSISK